jgi:FHA domain
MGVKELFGGLTEGELAQPDLLRRVTDGIAALARHAGKGTPVLPPEVEVQITVGGGSVQVVEQFVQDPAFDREIEARLLNELVKLRPEGLPVRRYIVSAGERTSVEVKESPRRRYQLRIEGGDRDGVTITLPPNRRHYLLGRGDWHGDEQEVANDVVLSRSDKAISRRAARLHRSTSGLELESLDQQQALVVERPNGEKLRPALASSGRVPLASGDRIAFTDGNQPILTLHFEEV